MNAPSNNAPDDRAVAELLRELGPRLEPPQDIIATVHAAVISEWRTLTTRRRRQRHVRTGALAASFLVAVTVALFSLRSPQEPAVPMATVLRIDGTLNILDRHGARVAKNGDTLVSGEQLTTDRGSRVALDLGDGLGLRIGSESRLELTAREQITLQSGVLYVDSGMDTTQLVPLTVHTAAGNVRHIGTQYQLRTLSGPAGTSGIEVSIREGQVLVDSAGHSSTASAGERLSISTRGRVVRSALAPFDPSWQWANLAAPQFDIGGRTLHDFLRWAAHETGRRLDYATPAARSAAEQLKLGGSIAGLDPDTALQAVLSTTKLRSSKTSPQRLRIALNAD